MTLEINPMIDASAPVGVFDSGVGGLTVVREIMRQIPNEKIIYFTFNFISVGYKN